MNYVAIIHDDNTVSLIKDADDQRIQVDIPGKPADMSINLSKEEFDSLFSSASTSVITYEDGDFVLTPKAPIS
jgi:hypothetical protein